MPADLVESIEVNKTLSANKDGHGIGGSVNLVTRTASGGETPVLRDLLGAGGEQEEFDGGWSIGSSLRQADFPPAPLLLPGGREGFAPPIAAAKSPTAKAAFAWRNASHRSRSANSL